jgi:FKBP-type peptidyl-prolyl cis-trans isomerase
VMDLRHCCSKTVPLPGDMVLTQGGLRCRLLLRSKGNQPASVPTGHNDLDRAQGCPREGGSSAAARGLRLLLRPLLLATLLLAAACGADEPEAPSCQKSPVRTESGLRFEDVRCGTGAEATDGSTLSVHYVGRLQNGERFDSSSEGEPFQFALGAGQVIQGWDEGLLGMKVGGTRRLTVPPELAFGEEGAPPLIPPNATLVFDIELVDVEEHTS